MKAIEITKNVYWVGAIDWELRNFHGYLTQRGSTYNAYLIIDEKVTLIDTVKAPFANEMLARISSVIDPSKIDYVVSNHVEMDHSGALPKVMEVATNAKIVTSPKGVKGLEIHYKKEWNFEVVKSGDSLSLGSKTLNYVLTPMVHWPDNMVTYLSEDKILFSNDAFGQHLATTERFDDEYPIGITLEEARKYYANIVLPYGNQVTKAVEGLKDIPIDIIAPSHGVIWRSHIKEILGEYQKWMSNETEDKALIVYDTMWNSTKKLAYSIASAFEENNIKTHIFNLQQTHMSDVMTELITAKYICVGSPTLNKNMLPTVSAFLTYFKGLAPKNRIGLAFGSYGWANQGPKHVHDTLKETGCMMGEMITVNFIPDEEQLNGIQNRVSDNIKNNNCICDIENGGN